MPKNDDSGPEQAFDLVDGSLDEADDEVIDLLEVVKPGNVPPSDADSDDVDFSKDLESMLDSLSEAEKAKAASFPDPTPVEHEVDHNESLDLPDMDDLDELLLSLGADAPKKDEAADSLDAPEADGNEVDDDLSLPDLDAAPVGKRTEKAEDDFEALMGAFAVKADEQAPEGADDDILAMAAPARAEGGDELPDVPTDALPDSLPDALPDGPSPAPGGDDLPDDGEPVLDEESALAELDKAFEADISEAEDADASSPAGDEPDPAADAAPPEAFPDAPGPEKAVDAPEADLDGMPDEAARDALEREFDEAPDSAPADVPDRMEGMEPGQPDDAEAAMAAEAPAASLDNEADALETALGDISPEDLDGPEDGAAAVAEAAPHEADADDAAARGEPGEGLEAHGSLPSGADDPADAPGSGLDEVDLVELDALLDDMLAGAPVSGPGPGVAEAEAQLAQSPPEDAELGKAELQADALAVIQSEMAGLRGDVNEALALISTVKESVEDARANTLQDDLTGRIDALELAVSSRSGESDSSAGALQLHADQIGLLDGRVEGLEDLREQVADMAGALERLENSVAELTANMDKLAAEAAARVIREELAALMAESAQ